MSNRPDSGHWCQECHEHHDSEEAAEGCCRLGFTIPVECDCYKCVGQDIRTTDSGREYVHNNMEYHTFMEPCDECGEGKTEYRDLGRKGRYVCEDCGP